MFGYSIGFTSRVPDLNALTMGEQPKGWAPVTLVSISSIRPSSLNWLRPLQMALSSAPLPIGTIIWSGVLHPSCSHTSNAKVFDPST